MTPSASWDVVIGGGGPAGLVTAIAARRRGLSVLVVERRTRLPLDKPCGEGLMPDGLAALGRLGITLEDNGRRLEGIRYLDGDRVAEARFAGAPGFGMRRTVLHRALLDSAARAGVDLRTGVRVLDIERRDGRFDRLVTSDGAIRGRTFVAADGLRSPLRKLAGLEGPAVAARQQRFGVRRHLRVAPWSDFVEVYWQDGTEAYVTPVDDACVGVAMLWRGRARGFDDLLTRHPRLAERIAGAERASRDAGCGPLLQRVRRVTRDNLALVGDASGYVDAITGEGLALAFQQAESLGHALGRGDLRVYERDHRRIGTLPDRMTRLVLALSRRPSLRRRAIAALAQRPGLFARLLAVHTREAPPRRAIIPVLRLLLGHRGSDCL